MAIKGKRKSRGGRSRAQAAAPKPKLVVPKKPLLRRTWVRAAGLLILAGGIAGGAVAGWAARRAAAEREQAQEAVVRVGVRIETAVAQVGSQVGPGAFLVLPEMGQAISQIRTGEYRERRIRGDAEEWAARLADVEAALAAIETDNGDLRRAIDRLLEGITVQAGVAADIPRAMDLEKKERRSLLRDLETKFQEANGTFNSGWLIYLNERIDVGLEGEDAPQPGVQTVIPPGFDPFVPPDDLEAPAETPVG